MPEHVCYFRILRSIEGGTAMSAQGEYRKKVLHSNASGDWVKYYLFENGDARCKVPMRSGGSEQGMLERPGGCISEALRGGGNMSWVDTVKRRGGSAHEAWATHALLTVAAFDGADCTGSHPRPTSAKYSLGAWGPQLSAARRHHSGRPLSHGCQADRAAQGC